MENGDEIDVMVEQTGGFNSQRWTLQTDEEFCSIYIKSSFKKIIK